MNSESAKTSLFCKWLNKTMEPGESNLELLLRYRHARFNPQRGRSWGEPRLVHLLKPSKIYVVQHMGAYW